MTTRQRGRTPPPATNGTEHGIDLGAIAMELQKELGELELRRAELRGQLRLIERLVALANGEIRTEGTDTP